MPTSRRQFEFIQNAWLQSPKFAGLGDEADPVTANRQPVPGGEGATSATGNFSLPQPNGVRRRISGLPPFVTVVGGGYFFFAGRTRAALFRRRNFGINPQLRYVVGSIKVLTQLWTAPRRTKALYSTESQPR